MKDFSNFPATTREPSVPEPARVEATVAEPEKDDMMNDDVKIRVAISTAKGEHGSHTKKTFRNIEVKFSTFIERYLSIPERTQDTVKMWQGKANYLDTGAPITDQKKTDVKDVGGFIGGHLKDGRREKEALLFRSVWTGDIEKDCTADDLKKIVKKLQNKRCFIYSTHSHTPKNPHVHIIMPLSRDVTPAEYEELSPYLTKTLHKNTTVPAFDEKSTKSPVQIMFFPSCPSDGDFYFKNIHGTLLDVDLYLKRAREDTTTPSVTRVKPSTSTDGQGGAWSDPREKEGDIGTFCRAYNVYEVIEKFLQGIYEATPDKNRFMHIGSKGAPGLVVVDNGGYAFSHHENDPISKLPRANAFDMFCVHRFNGNVKAALKAARVDPLFIVQEQIDREAEVYKDFKIEGEAPEITPASVSWKSQLKRQDKTGAVLPTITNCVVILENDKRFKDFAYNVMSGKVEVTGTGLPWKREGKNGEDNPGPFWNERDRAHLIQTLDALYLPFSEHTVDIAFTVVADRRRFSPLKNWLEGLPAWDKVPRLYGLLTRCFKAERSDYTAAVLRKTMLAAITRIYHPGSKFDYVPVLDGAQGIGKSKFWALLAGEGYFTDALTLADMKDKTGAENIQGYWFAEIAELAGMRKVEIASTRAFITRQFDDYRAPFARVSERRPRRGVLVATVNGQRGYLRDPEGDRRFWSVKCFAPEGACTWTITEDERRQLWSEALFYYHNGYLPIHGGTCEPLEMDTPELRQAALDAQREATEKDDRTGGIETYLNTLVPTHWRSMDIYQKRHFLNNQDEQGTVIRDRVCGLEIWTECLEGDPGRFDGKAQATVQRIMKSLSDVWEPVSTQQRYLSGRARSGYVRHFEHPGKGTPAGELLEQINEAIDRAVMLDFEAEVKDTLADFNILTGDTFNRDAVKLLRVKDYAEFLEVLNQKIQSNKN